MLTNILITITLLLITAFILSRIFILPRNIWLLFIAQPLVMSASPIIVFIGGILSSKMANDPSLATLPITLMILGVAAGSIPAAMLAKNKGRKFAVYTGLSCSLIAVIIALISAKLALFSLFCFASLLIGIGGAFTQQLRFAAIESSLHKEDVPKILSILMLSGVFAAFLGPEVAVAGKDWLNSPYGYVGSFLFLAALILCAMFMMLAFKNPPLTSNETSGEPRALSVIIKQPIFLIAVCTATIGFALMSYLMTATPISMHHMQGHSLQETKWVIQSHIAAMYIPSLFTPWLVKYLKLKGLMLIGTVIYAIVALIALSGHEVMHYWWALILLGIGWNFLFLTGTSLLPESYHASERHNVQATNDFILFGFQAAGSLLAGWVLFNAGWHWVVITSLPFILILFSVVAFYHRHQKQLVTNHSTNN
ncbi:MFS transporter [Colwellia psychrerythraea]|uniref:Major facilitator superfamily MFS_1 n=1 Tax=Colwellia psychrerythraea TaxID=28229 RepID=A0A099KTG2_COLPS|nr:MFS transporter [Colwellia psychrerythraea]KGJ94054.1 major facilitator superfamily MFS_1 [Colwellia psychrerythraea]